VGGEFVEAVLERLTYVNEETGYTVARMATGRDSDLLTVVGALLGAQRGRAPNGLDVDFATVWVLGHTVAERTGDGPTNFIAWVKETVAK
jgi:hypothetical protein